MSEQSGRAGYRPIAAEILYGDMAAVEFWLPRLGISKPFWTLHRNKRAHGYMEPAEPDRC